MQKAFRRVQSRGATKKSWGASYSASRPEVMKVNNKRAQSGGCRTALFPDLPTYLTGAQAQRAETMFLTHNGEEKSRGKSEGKSGGHTSSQTT